MYTNGHKPQVGDKVKRNWYDKNMALGEEGVVSWVGENDRIKIAGKPEDSGFLASFFELLSRGVRYSDGKDAAAGDLVECVEESCTQSMFTGVRGQRYTVTKVTGNMGDGEGAIDLHPCERSKDCGLRPHRFKLIARACPYKVGDWVHYNDFNGRGEFQVKSVNYSDSPPGGWRVRDTVDPMKHNDVLATMVKPGRLPPISLADEVRAIMTEGDSLYMGSRRVWKVDKIVELIDAKTNFHRKLSEMVEKELSEEQRTVAKQSDMLRGLRAEVARYQQFIHVNADYKALYENLRNKLRGIAE